MFGSTIGYGNFGGYGAYRPRGYMAAGIGYPYQGFAGYPGYAFGYPGYGIGYPGYGYGYGYGCLQPLYQ